MQNMEEALKDERFSHILSDPRFRKMPKHVRKVALDKRMKKIFEDSSFKEKCELDKRGRLLNLTPAENLKKLYDVTSESSDNEEDIDENCIVTADELNQNTHSRKKSDSVTGKSKGKDIAEELVHDAVSDDDDDDDVLDVDDDVSDVEDDVSDEEDDKDQRNKTSKVKEKKKGNLVDEESDESSSEESDDSDSESEDGSGNESEDVDHKWEELRNEAPDTNEITQRLAVCNMDWDRIRAVDLFVCFDSFKPSDGCINSVKIYPSEYGLKRMEEEQLKGPPELVEKTLALDEEELQDRKGSKYHREKLRQYQISRLKYYYAVVDCDSPETANVLYEQLNGMEYESSSIRFDLRFIPDDVTFDHDPTSTADKLPDQSEYKPRLFVTSALQQVKVDLTWDETDPKRRDFFQKIFIDPDSVQNDIQDFIASASSESEAEENVSDEEPVENMKMKDRIAKYRELLLSLEEKEKGEEEKYDIEVTWEPNLKEKAEKQVKEKLKKDGLNPFEEMLQKKKEERKIKKKEQKKVQKQSEDSSDDDSEEEADNTSASNKKVEDEKRLAELALISDSKNEMNFEEKTRKKSKKDKSRNLDDFVGNPNDPRFAAMHTSSLFNMIPSSSQTKKNGGKFVGKSDKRKFKSKKDHESHKRAKY